MKITTAMAGIALACLAAGVAQASGFDPQAATDAYLATVAGEAKARSDAYFEGGYWLTLWDALYGIGVGLVLLFTRISLGLRVLAERMFGWRWLQTFAFAVMFVALTSLLTLPLTYWEGFVREHAFGLSNQTVQEWASEYAIGLGISAVMSGILITALYAIIRRAGDAWWLWGTGLIVVFFAVSSAIAPVFIAPLFNDYKPMREGPLKQEILALARANGVPTDQVYEFDASRQSKRISANVSGFLGTTRVSLNDNLLNRATPAEVRAVMAHEIGHYALGHVYEMIVTISLITAVSLLLARWGFAVLHGAFGGFWGVHDIADPAGLPILAMLLSVIGLLSTPVTNSMIRVNEAEADIFGLNAAREPDAFATIALKLGEYRKLDPTPWEEFVFFDHPSGRSRISMAMRWKAENMPAPAPANAPSPAVMAPEAPAAAAQAAAGTAPAPSSP